MAFATTVDNGKAQLLPRHASHLQEQRHREEAEEEREVDDDDDEEADNARILYRASFADHEDHIVNYETAQWILLSLMLVLAWGVGLLMLLCLPLRRHAIRQDVRSRRLYVTANAIVYKVEKPVLLPCFGVNRREKHILLPLVTDVAIEQGCLQSAYKIHSIRIENASHRKPPPGDDLQILGVVNPRMFRKVVLMALANLRREHDSRVLAHENSAFEESHGDVPMSSIPRRPLQGWAWQQGGTGLSSWQMSYPPINDFMHDGPSIVSGETILKKLDEIGCVVKRLEVLVEQPGSKAKADCQDMIASMGENKDRY